MTIAEQISARLDDDRRNFRAHDGSQPLDVTGEERTHWYLSETGARHDALISWRASICDGRRNGTYRIHYLDGSAIIVSGDCWDLAVVGSAMNDFCLSGEGHSYQSGCEHSPELD